jgi:hypothetical protein
VRGLTPIHETAAGTVLRLSRNRVRCGKGLISPPAAGTFHANISVINHQDKIRPSIAFLQAIMSCFGPQTAKRSCEAS